LQITDGQQWALAQLHDVAANGQAIEILAATNFAKEGGWLEVELSIDCSAYPRAEGGLILRQRERVKVNIPPDFPLRCPEVRSAHKRFAGFPHVQWGSHLCLYQAPDTEWLPADGMFGFLDRLDMWLRAGSLGQLDPIGLPLHPPVAYPRSGQYVVPRVDTPSVEPPWWAGYAEITSENKGAVILGAWHAYDATVPTGRLAGAILLSSADMPFEYPGTFSVLARTLAERSVPLVVLRAVLKLTALRAEADSPLYVLLGAAMRGISGEAERKQHLACWYINSERASQLRQLALSSSDDAEAAARDFEAWAEDTQIDWCPVREDRPEIVTPRDAGSPLAWWRSRRVTILGCGALGSSVALMLARAGVQCFRLYDHSGVAPGVLSRQQFGRNQIGFTKVSATRNNLLAINPDVVITEHSINIVDALQNDPETLFDCDVVVNATASTRVAAALERFLVDQTRQHPPILSMVVGHRCDVGLLSLGVAGIAGVTLDLDRRAKIALANSSNGHDFLDEFWPLPGLRHKLFQPEPGCSAPTFVGSAADVLGLSAELTNIASTWLRAGTACARTCFIRSPHSQRRPNMGVLQFEWAPDRIVAEHRHGFQIRIATAAERDLRGWIRSSARLRGPKVETGGLLFGQIDDFLKIIWITEVSGPPPDSVASRTGFLCGVKGTAELSKEKQTRTRGSVKFLGMWHTHPGGYPSPSTTDLSAMEMLLARPSELPRHFLMLILGGQMSSPQFEGFAFARSEEVVSGRLV